MQMISEATAWLRTEHSILLTRLREGMGSSCLPIHGTMHVLATRPDIVYCRDCAKDAAQEDWPEGDPTTCTRCRQWRNDCLIGIYGNEVVVLIFVLCTDCRVKELGN